MTHYVGTCPSCSAMSRELAAHRAVITSIGGCPSRDANFSETRTAAKEKT